MVGWRPSIYSQSVSQGRREYERRVRLLVEWNRVAALSIAEILNIGEEQWLAIKAAARNGANRRFNSNNSNAKNKQ